MLESEADYARYRGCNRSTINRLKNADRLVMVGKLVDREASDARIAATADPLKEGVRRRHERERRGKGQQGEPSTRLDPNDTSYHELTRHRAASEATRAELLQLELAEKEGRLVDAETVRRRELQLSRAGREGVMNLRYRLDPLLAGETDPQKRAELWDRECNAICEEIARATATPLEKTDAEK